MRALACLSTFAVAILLFAWAPVPGRKAFAEPNLKYTITNEDCKTQGSGQAQTCTSCSTVLTSVGTGTCGTGWRCDAVKCTGGTTMFDACTSGGTASGSNCGTKQGNGDMTACTTCSTYVGTCLVAGSCSSPGCGGNGTATMAPKILLCP